MKTLVFDNRFVRELPGDPEEGPRIRQVHGACYSRVMPTPVAKPQLLAWSPEVGELLGWGLSDAADPVFAEVFGGNRLLPGMEPYAACYGGHQFGNWAGQLGDGRAITLGETVNAAGQRWELQLKGAGPTPYSRRADGRAVLRSSIREFLCSEAMHHLGVPTTRALCLVGTGEQVVRDMFYNGNPQYEPGAVVCRVAPSFIRFGNFEIFSSRGDADLLAKLVDFTIARDFPEIEGSPTERRIGWFHEVCRRTAVMVAHWIRVGFVHGVMNTDNMSILGLTIDYGPYGWIDNFDTGWTPNTTDEEMRRYRFGHQPKIAHWNLWQLANALYPALKDAKGLEAALEAYSETYTRESQRMTADKLGLEVWQDGDGDQVERLHRLLEVNEVDMSLFYRALAVFDPDRPDFSVFDDAFYDPEKRDAARPEFEAWLADYAARLSAQGVPQALRQERMNAVNPLYVPRNYLAQQAIDLAEKGDLSGVHTLLDVFRRPYEQQPGREAYAAKRPDWARVRPGCSMLSCSS
ncbi:protein adenylyltransferase SelO [Parazoarcus communis]|uniref:Protein nucleotidyltransferase YdiU n=1 Tax=Parazoarcus communis SWub3 = DSM 12120 TaxID=1121029 RepID=A0A323UUB5_9RHOO|nr:YdiU family protein [Parazoarcus communis]NMG70217.1 YdiU family protein [Parazoarcus communis SWub3 = DSM 12120]PZA15997.1 YdiU family protein [Azoarcus communis] [Parazoarcus communis SWub3 = DSM 12120]